MEDKCALADNTEGSGKKNMTHNQDNAFTRWQFQKAKSKATTAEVMSSVKYRKQNATHIICVTCNCDGLILAQFFSTLSPRKAKSCQVINVYEME